MSSFTRLYDIWGCRETRVGQNLRVQNCEVLRVQVRKLQKHHLVKHHAYCQLVQTSATELTQRPHVGM